MTTKQWQHWIEHLAILFASFVWTSVVLSIIILVWAYQAVRDDWKFQGRDQPFTTLAQASSTDDAEVISINNLIVEPTVQVEISSTAQTTPVNTPVPPPSLLPETVGIGDATPIPITENQSHSLNQAKRQLSSEDDAPTLHRENNTAKDVTLEPSDSANVIPTRIEIPAIRVNSDILPVGWRLVEQNGQRFSIWDVADYAVGWHQTTALLGQSGNTVMAGHNNINGEVFRDLSNVEVGDKIIAYANDRIFEYTVETKTIVKEKGEPPEVRRRNAQWIAPTTDERLTLVSCWPYTSNTHRIIVVAKPS